MKTPKEITTETGIVLKFNQSAALDITNMAHTKWKLKDLVVAMSTDKDKYQEYVLFRREKGSLIPIYASQKAEAVYAHVEMLGLAKIYEE